MNDREPHISDLAWDRLLAGELTGDARARTHAHAASCAACGARMRELTAQREAFKLRPVGFALHAPARRARWWWGAPIAGLAAVAIAVVILRPPAEPAHDGTTKGTGAKLLLSAGKPGALVPLASGDPIFPGDYLQAGYTASRDGFGAVLALDGSGGAFAYAPSRGDVMVALPAGTERSFPESTVLDDVTGTEHVFVLWCDQAHTVKPLLDQLRATRAVIAPAGCTSRAVVLEKRAMR